MHLRVTVQLVQPCIDDLWWAGEEVGTAAWLQLRGADPLLLASAWALFQPRGCAREHLRPGSRPFDGACPAVQQAKLAWTNTPGALSPETLSANTVKCRETLRTSCFNSKVYADLGVGIPYMCRS